MAEINKRDPGRRVKARKSSPPPTGSFMKPKRLLTGLGWNTIGQFLVIGINLGLTPFLLHRLGATQYGIFALLSTARGLISNLDGGLSPTGTRYIPVHVGRGNAATTTSFLFTMLTLVLIVVGAETAVLVLFAPVVARVFALGSSIAGYSHEIAQLTRELMPALLIAAVRTPIQRLVMAHDRWAFLNYAQIIAVAAYTVTAVLLSYKTPGPQCLVWGTYVQEVILITTAAWACRRYVSLKGMHLLPISEVREILRFGSRIQTSAIASSFNYEVDALLVGFFFPIKDVAYYTIGVNYSQQVLNMPFNGLSPIVQEVGRSYGKSGKEGVLRLFPKTQRTWVTALGIFPIVAALQGWFGIRVWIGPGSQLAATTATILIIGSIPVLFNSIIDVTAKVVGMPEIESWYLGIGVAINVACTIPLALGIGVIGVPIGTAIGLVVSYFACIHLARKKIGKEITSFYHDVDYFPGFVAIVLALACEWSFHNNLPSGGIGFVLNGMLTLPAFVTYYGWVYREPLLKRLGNGRHRQLDPDYSDRRTERLADDSAYTVRQLNGILALMAIAEPKMAVVPFSGAFAQLRYTGPLEQAHWSPLSPPVRQETRPRNYFEGSK